MGIDLIRGGRIPNRGFKKTKSTNQYLKTLIKVSILSFSFIHSFPEEHNQGSTQQSIKDSTNQDSIDILFQFRESLKHFQMMKLGLLKGKINLIAEL